MSNLTVNLSLPRELVALELVRQGRISIGKGAKLLGIAKADFIQILARHQVDYFTTTPAALEAEVMIGEALITQLTN